MNNPVSTGFVQFDFPTCSGRFQRQISALFPQGPIFVCCGLFGVDKLWQTAQIIYMCTVPNKFIMGQKALKQTKYISPHAVRHSNWLNLTGITRVTQFYSTSLGSSSVIYKEVFCLSCQKKPQIEICNVIVSFDPKQRPFCLCDCCQTNFFFFFLPNIYLQVLA